MVRSEVAISIVHIKSWKQPDKDFLSYRENDPKCLRTRRTIADASALCGYQWLCQTMKYPPYSDIYDKGYKKPQA